jgi:peptide-methionine (S)-S-oxide reductase
MTRRSIPVLMLTVAALALTAAHAADPDQPAKKTAVATFAGGCFWCMEPPFDAVKGVRATISGYTGGEKKNPTYHEVSEGKTGHCEAIQVEYDPAVVTYRQLLQVYWHNVDPTTGDRQFCDWGTQYRPEIFYHDEAQKAAAEASKREVEKKFGEAAVKITPAGVFYPAEEYHQDFYTKEPDHYHDYRKGCGRDRRLLELWGDDAGQAHSSH